MPGLDATPASSPNRRSPSQRANGRSAATRPQGRARQLGSTSPPSASASRSIFSTCKDLLTLKRHGARTIEGLLARLASRLLTLAACIALNHRLGRPSRSLVAYTA
jgi:hypothetical protein